MPLFVTLPHVPFPCSYCINLALQNVAEFSFVFGAICSATLCSPGEVDLLRGGCANAVRLLKNITVLHLAALHASDEVNFHELGYVICSVQCLCLCPCDFMQESFVLLKCLLQVASMLMQHSVSLGLDVHAMCVATVGKKQFKMTALDIAGCPHVVCLCATF